MKRSQLGKTKTQAEAPSETQSIRRHSSPLEQGNMSNSQTISSDPHWNSSREAPPTQTSLTVNPERKHPQKTYFKLAKALQVWDKLGEGESIMA